jgi:PhzF family phenazine biosynthesis protein
MELTYYQIDAFTDKVFGGNYAGVIVLDAWLDEALMQNIAMENNVSETAFIVLDGNNAAIRWFSPLTEIDFCGHATLAAAHVLFRLHPDIPEWHFHTQKVGSLVVWQENGRIAMRFPLRPPETVETIPAALYEGLSITPVEVLRSPQAWFAVYEDAEQVLSLQSDSAILATLAPYDVVATAPGDAPYDFSSRYFWPANGGDEDPVTGSIHAGLAPFWATRLGRTTLTARQASSRGGTLYCQVNDNHLVVSGDAVDYLSGTLFL